MCFAFSHHLLSFLPFLLYLSTISFFSLPTLSNFLFPSPHLSLFRVLLSSLRLIPSSVFSFWSFRLWLRWVESPPLRSTLLYVTPHHSTLFHLHLALIFTFWSFRLWLGWVESPPLCSTLHYVTPHSTTLLHHIRKAGHDVVELCMRSRRMLHERMMP